MFKKFGNPQFSKWSFLWNTLINLLENRLCCRFSVVSHLSKFRENIKYFCKCNSYICGCAFIGATGKTRIYFKIYYFRFLFYIFHLKCFSFVTGKIKSTKFKEGLGYFSLVTLLSPMSSMFHSFSCIWAILQEGTDQNKHLKESDPHYCDPKSQVFSDGFSFQWCWLLLGFLCSFGVIFD